MGNISKIRTNGFATAVPGTYLEELVVENDTERPLSAGKFLALVGAFDFLEGGKAHEVTTGTGMRKISPKSQLLKKMAGVCYAPASNLSGAPEKVLLTTTMTTTQAQLMLLDASGDDSVLLKSKLWGPRGNLTLVSLIANSGDSTLRDLTVSRDGVTDTLTALGSGNIIRLFYVSGSGVATSVEVLYDTTAGLKLISKYAALAAGSLTGAQCARIMIGGVIKGTPSGAQTGANTATLTVQGTNNAGAATTGTATWALADGTTQKTVQAAAADVSWTAVTGVTWATQEGGITVALEFHKLFGPTEFGSFKDVVDYITGFGNGYNVSEDSALVERIGLTDADVVAQTPLGANLGAAIGIRADVWAIVQAVNEESQLVTAEIPTTDVAARSVPAAITGTVGLGGGSAVGGSTAEAFETAFTRLRTPKPHVIWAYSNLAGVHAKLDAHIDYMTGPGRGQCWGWVGGASNETFAQADARTRALNTRHIRYVGQDVEFETDRGSELHDPTWLALYAAAINAIVGVAEPLSNGYTLNASAVRNLQWDLDNEIEQLIEARVSVVKQFDNGLQLVRPLTTHRQTGDPSLTEASGDESICMCIRDVQENVDALGISKVSEVFGSRVVSVTKSRLRLQLKAGWIASADFASVILRQEAADRVSDGWDFVAAVPANFIGLRPRVRRGSFVIGG